MFDGIVDIIREEIQEMDLCKYPYIPNIRQVIGDRPRIAGIEINESHPLGVGYLDEEVKGANRYKIILGTPEKLRLKEDDIKNAINLGPVVPQKNRAYQSPDIGSAANPDAVDRIHGFVSAHEFAHIDVLFSGRRHERLTRELDKCWYKKRATEVYCDLFASYCFFPPEQDFGSSRREILELGKAESFMDGLMSLSRKRQLGLFQLIPRLAISDFYSQNFQDNFALVFGMNHHMNTKYEGRAWRLIPGANILPAGVGFKGGFNLSFEDIFLSGKGDNPKASGWENTANEQVGTDLWSLGFVKVSNLIYLQANQLSQVIKEDQGKAFNFNEKSPLVNHLGKELSILEMNHIGIVNRCNNEQYLILAGKVERK